MKKNKTGLQLRRSPRTQDRNQLQKKKKEEEEEEENENEGEGEGEDDDESNKEKDKKRKGKKKQSGRRTYGQVSESEEEEEEEDKSIKVESKEAKPQDSDVDEEDEADEEDEDNEILSDEEVKNEKNKRETHTVRQVSRPKSVEFSKDVVVCSFNKLKKTTSIQDQNWYYLPTKQALTPQEQKYMRRVWRQPRSPSPYRHAAPTDADEENGDDYVEVGKKIFNTSLTRKKNKTRGRQPKTVHYDTESSSSYSRVSATQPLSVSLRNNNFTTETISSASAYAPRLTRLQQHQQHQKQQEEYLTSQEQKSTFRVRSPTPVRIRIEGKTKKNLNTSLRERQRQRHLPPPSPSPLPLPSTTSTTTTPTSATSTSATPTSIQMHTQLSPSSVPSTQTHPHFIAHPPTYSFTQPHSLSSTSSGPPLTRSLSKQSHHDNFSSSSLHRSMPVNVVAIEVAVASPPTAFTARTTPPSTLMPPLPLSPSHSFDPRHMTRLKNTSTSNRLCVVIDIVNIVASYRIAPSDDLRTPKEKLNDQRAGRTNVWTSVSLKKELVLHFRPHINHLMHALFGEEMYRYIMMGGRVDDIEWSSENEEEKQHKQFQQLKQQQQQHQLRRQQHQPQPQHYAATEEKQKTRNEKDTDKAIDDENPESTKPTRKKKTITKQQQEIEQKKK